MNANATHAKLMAIVDILLAVPDEFGLHEVCAEVRYGLDIADDRNVAAGAQADFDDAGPTDKHSSKRTPDEIILHIDREWDALGAPPSIGDICSFEWTPAAMEAYVQSHQQRSI